MAIWEERAAAAQAKRDASLAKVEPKIEGLPAEMPLNTRGIPATVLTEREVKITEGYSVAELLRVLKARELSVEEVTRAFLRRAAVAQAAVSCLRNHSVFVRTTKMGCRPTALLSSCGISPLPEPRSLTLGRSLRESFSAFPSQPRSITAWLAPTLSRTLHALRGSISPMAHLCCTSRYMTRGAYFMQGQLSLRPLCTWRPSAMCTAVLLTRITAASHREAVPVVSLH